jgi:hypothetical protein
MFTNALTENMEEVQERDAVLGDLNASMENVPLFLKNADGTDTFISQRSKSNVSTRSYHKTNVKRTVAKLSSNAQMDVNSSVKNVKQLDQFSLLHINIIAHLFVSKMVNVRNAAHGRTFVMERNANKRKNSADTLVESSHTKLWSTVKRKLQKQKLEREFVKNSVALGL